MITVIEIASNRAEWNAFAEKCQTSFRCSYDAITAWQLDYHFCFRVRRFEFYIDDEGQLCKIGQCGIGFSRRRRVFADGLQILPEYALLWGKAMEALLVEIGPGLYHYGSPWSTTALRISDLSAIAGVVIDDVRPIQVQAVDFSCWESWIDYFRQVSKNARYNARRARDHYSDLEVVLRYGLWAIPDGIRLIRLRTAMYRRKNIKVTRWKLTFRFLTQLLAMRAQTFTSVARSAGRVVAGISGIEFGKHTYLMAAASVPDKVGVSWFLLLWELKRAYTRVPDGKVVMGWLDDATEPGLLFFRQQCRAASSPGGTMVFSYYPTCDNGADVAFNLVATRQILDAGVR